jgi:hypothetical protein
MPDFLHEENGHDGAVNAVSSLKLEDRTEGLNPQKNRDGVKMAAPKARASDAPAKRKMPFVIFTHYYGVFFLFLIALFIGLGYIVFVPRYGDMVAIAGEIGTAEATLQEEESYLGALNQSIEAAEAIPAETVGKVDEAIPRANTGIPKMLVTMAAIARASGVELGNVEFSESGPMPGIASRKLGISPIHISTSVQADGYQEMRKFLSNLEQSLRLVDVNSIAVSAGAVKDEKGGGGEHVAFNYALQLTAYTLSSAPPISAANAQPAGGSTEE